MRRLAKRRIVKVIAVFTALNLLTSIVYPTASLALTGGPGQSETSSFTAVGTSEMVDLFSGDFSYNIPLLDVGGYPINLGYKSGITTDQEASVVGLGWNINPGAISRGVRGLPDDFKGDEVVNRQNQKMSSSFGINGNFNTELFGLDFLNLGVGAGISYNNYKGLGLDVSLNPSLEFTKRNHSGGSNSASLGLNLKLSSMDGVSATPELSFSRSIKNSVDADNNMNRSSVSISAPYNTRAGLQSLTMGFSGASGPMKKIKTDNGEMNVLAKSIGGGASGTLSTFSTPSYTPSSPTGMANVNASFSVKPGGHAWFVQMSGQVGGFLNFQWPKEKVRRSQGYGYLYAQDALEASTDSRMLDFNRSNDGTVSENTPNIALASQTYDTWSVSGQGVGGSYRPYRGDVGLVYDQTTRDGGGGFSVGGFDLSGGNLMQSGATVEINASSGYSGAWFNSSTGSFGFSTKSNGSLHEPVYFQSAGEMVTETDPGFMDAVGGNLPAAVSLNGRVGSVRNQVTLSDGSTRSLSRRPRNARARRNQVMSYLRADEVPLKEGETQSTIEYYSYETSGDPSSPIKKKIMNRVDSKRKKHHISQMEVLRNDGMRYVYGIPAYNNKQKEVTFSVANPGDDATVASTGVINYSDTDASTDNNQGLNNSYQSNELPAYAHSYLLTGIVSPDYVDRTNDGLTPDDFGTYTKFNYIKWKDGYKWRTPFVDANYNEGIKCDVTDDKASYTYGEKEIWYLYSIETRTHEAVFKYSTRDDSYGAEQEHNRKGGDFRGDGLLKLDLISLYSKPEADYSRSQGRVPVAIKQAHFMYNYSLMGENGASIDNNINSGGKLTLTGLYFTYQGSSKGAYSPYRFRYCYEDREGSKINNYDHHDKAYDRWGNYKPPVNNSSLKAENGEASNGEFPYVDQSVSPESEIWKKPVNLHASAWTMTAIELPSGGKIEIDYEADDYAFVQDRQAMQMMKITGVTNSAGGSINDIDINNNIGKLFEGNDDASGNQYLVFKLQKPLPPGTHDQIERYFVDLNGDRMENLYFRFLIRINPNGSGNNDFGEDRYAYVPGYITPESWGVYGANGQQTAEYGYVKVKEAGYGRNNNKGVHPITKAAWQYARLHQPHLAYGGPEPSTTAAENLNQVLDVFEGLGKAVESAVAGYGDFMRNREAGKKFVKNKSWIRVLNPILCKKGGGVRVRSLRMYDQWQDMVQANPSTAGQAGNYYNEYYGQEYRYRTYSEVLEDSVSSGVAAYEPALGGDENPWKQPDTYDEERKLAPDDQYYQEKPYGEAFFPGASVGYSRVEVYNVQKEGVSKHRSGKVVHEFYTAKDFPTIVRKTYADKEIQTPNFGLGLLGFVRTGMTVSQGYSIELNNMHGMQKGQKVFAEDAEGIEDYISAVEYFYKMDSSTTYYTPKVNSNGDVIGRDEHSGPPVLNNKIQTVDKDGNIQDENLGVDFEMVVDTRTNYTESVAAGLSGNLLSFILGLFPGVVVTLIPTISESETEFTSMSTTKVVQRKGIMVKTVAHDLGADVTTENVLYDQETGQVLLTKTTNQFDDPVYSFTYPAHWRYEGMGLAYKNLGLEVENQSITGLGVQNLTPGDELLLMNNGSAQRAWVITTSPLRVADINNVDVSTSTTWDKAKIIRSGRRNLASQSIGSITSLQNPIVDGKLVIAQPAVEWENSPYASSILNAETIEFGNQWKVFCNCNEEDLSEQVPYNDYTSGQFGTWRPLRSNLYLTTRVQDLKNSSTTIRTDGRYKTFSPFWVNKSGEWDKDTLDWTWTSNVTLFSQRGQELENQDRLYRRSGANYRYSDLLPIAVSNNAYHREIGNDNFEDYNFSYQCQDDHFSFRRTEADVRKQAHTGRSSLMVGAGKEARIQKVIEECGKKDVREVNGPGDSGQ